MAAKSSPKLKTKRGLLTPYALACGYIQTREIVPDIRITLWFEGGYHVRAYDHAAQRRLFWVVVSSLTEARKIYQRGYDELGTI